MRSAVAGAVALLLLLPVTAPAAGGLPQEAEALRLMMSAQRMVRDNEIDKAIDEYAFLVEQFPTSDLADDALLETALAQIGAGRPLDAASTAQRLVDAYPRTGSAAGGLFLLADLKARSAPSREVLEEARDELRRIPIAFPPSSFPALIWRGHAKGRAGELSLVLGEEIEAAAVLIDAIENEPRTVATARALLAFATLLGNQGEWAAASQALQEIRDTFDPADPDMAPWIDAAGRRLSLIHRTVLRTAAGQSPWRRAFPKVVSGMRVDRPVGVAADAAGRLIISDDGENAVGVVEADGTLVSRRGLQDPGKPWWTADGRPMVTTRAWVANALERGHTTLTARGGRKPGPLQKILAAESGLFGSLYVVDEDNNRFLHFDPSGGHAATPMESSRAEPVDVARDHQGRLYLVDKKEKKVRRYAPGGALERTVVNGTWDRAEAIAIDELGNIYVLDRNDKTIEVFDRAGRRIARVGPGLPSGAELDSPRDIAVDGSGRLYIADRDRDAILMLE